MLVGGNISLSVYYTGDSLIILFVLFYVQGIASSLPPFFAVTLCICLISPLNILVWVSYINSVNLFYAADHLASSKQDTEIGTETRLIHGKCTDKCMSHFDRLNYD